MEWLRRLRRLRRCLRLLCLLVSQLLLLLQLLLLQLLLLQLLRPFLLVMLIPLLYNLLEASVVNEVLPRVCKVAEHSDVPIILRHWKVSKLLENHHKTCFVLTAIYVACPQCIHEFKCLFAKFGPLHTPFRLLHWSVRSSWWLSVRNLRRWAISWRVAWIGWNRNWAIAMRSMRSMRSMRWPILWRHRTVGPIRRRRSCRASRISWCLHSRSPIQTIWKWCALVFLRVPDAMKNSYSRSWARVCDHNKFPIPYLSISFHLFLNCQHKVEHACLYWSVQNVGTSVCFFCFPASTHSFGWHADRLKGLIIEDSVSSHDNCGLGGSCAFQNCYFLVARIITPCDWCRETIGQSNWTKCDKMRWINLLKEAVSALLRVEQYLQNTVESRIMARQTVWLSPNQSAVWQCLANLV